MQAFQASVYPSARTQAVSGASPAEAGLAVACVVASVSAPQPLSAGLENASISLGGVHACPSASISSLRSGQLALRERLGKRSRTAGVGSAAAGTALVGSSSDMQGPVLCELQARACGRMRAGGKAVALRGFGQYAVIALQVFALLGCGSDDAVDRASDIQDTLITMGATHASGIVREGVRFHQRASRASRRPSLRRFRSAPLHGRKMRSWRQHRPWLASRSICTGLFLASLSIL